MSRIAVEIWTDIVCPWCYIGKRRFEAALADFDHRDAVDVRWRSFELEPEAQREADLTIPQRMQQDLGLTEEQARRGAENVTALAAEVGLTYRLENARPVNSFDSHRVMHLAAAHDVGVSVQERLMAAYTAEGADLGNRETLVRLAAEAGLQPEITRAALGGEDFAEAVRSDEDRAHAFSVNSVPFFVFQGRFRIAGAQPVAVFADLLWRVWDEATLPISVMGEIS